MMPNVKNKTRQNQKTQEPIFLKKPYQFFLL